MSGQILASWSHWMCQEQVAAARGLAGLAGPPEHQVGGFAFNWEGPLYDPAQQQQE